MSRRFNKHGTWGFGWRDGTLYFSRTRGEEEGYPQIAQIPTEPSAVAPDAIANSKRDRS